MAKRRRPAQRLLTVGLICLAAASVANAGPKVHHDFEVGVNENGQLTIRGDEKILGGMEMIELLPWDYPGNEPGFAPLFHTALPGWEGIEEDEPDEGLYALPSGHQVALLRLGFDPGFSMHFDAITPILENDGDAFLFPQDAEGGFHHDLFYAGVGPVGTIYEAGFQLVNLSDIPGLSDSDVYTLRFIVVPEPTAGLVLLAGILARGRSRLRLVATV